MTEPTPLEAGPRIQRVRHELRRRTLTVLRIERPTPQLVRVVLGGPEISGFTSLGFDDHVKLFFPAKPGAPEGAVMRDFTPRHFSAEAQELWIDFFLHQSGSATAWASQVQVGQTLQVGGPRGSMVIEPQDIDFHLLVGDETAWPAIERRLQELPKGAKAHVLLEVDPGTPWPKPASDADFKINWVPRDGQPGPGHELIQALTNIPLPGRSFCWVAGESQSVRAIRRHLVEERGIGKRWVKAAGYWQRGAVGTHERIDDEAGESPTQGRGQPGQ